MTRLLHQTPSPWPGGYSSSELASWLPGEVREVEDHVATYLVSTYPDVFVLVAPPEAPEPPKKSVKRGRQ